jgi:hypothetical protein
MIVDEATLLFPTDARPMVGGRIDTGQSLPQTRQPAKTLDAKDELPMAFVPPPVALTRVFPGL